jgi:hypothetical protein
MQRLGPLLVVATLALTACGADEGASSPAPPADPTAQGPVTDTAGATIAPTNPPSEPPTTEPLDPDPQYDPVALRNELEQARSDWAEFDTPSYRYRYVPVCFCDPEPIEANVIDGKLVNDTGDARLHSIENWFDIIDEAIGTAHLVRAVYNDWGYPDSVYIDVDEMIADEEFGLVFDGYFHIPDAVEIFLADDHGCGYGFAAASPNQSVSFQSFFSTEPEPGTYELADAEFAEVQFGTDLMANWCDDVVEPDEPEPVVDERWTIVGGTVTITFDDQQATGELRDIVARTADGRDYTLGNATIVNDAWGMFAG